MYSIRHLSKKLSEHYGAEGSKVRLTQHAGLPKIMLPQKEANSIVADPIFDSSVAAATKSAKEFLGNDQQTESTEGTNRFYSYPNELKC